MPRPQNKTQLLAETHTQYQALEKFLAGLTPAQMTRPGALGEWSMKDVLAHLYEWQQMFFRWYEAGLRGETPAVPAQGFKWSELPALNQKIYETYRDMPLDTVLGLFRASHTRTLALVEALSDETLTRRGLYPWMNDNALIAYLNANCSSHYRWALTGMRKGLKAMV